MRLVHEGLHAFAFPETVCLTPPLKDYNMGLLLNGSKDYSMWTACMEINYKEQVLFFSHDQQRLTPNMCEGFKASHDLGRVICNLSVF